MLVDSTKRWRGGETSANSAVSVLATPILLNFSPFEWCLNVAGKDITGKFCNVY